MQVRGNIMWAAGLLLFLFALFLYDPSLPTYGGAFGPDRVVNADRQQHQLLYALAGLTLFLAGAIVEAIGELAQRNTLAGPREESEPRPPSAPQPSKSAQANAEMLVKQGVRPGDDGAQV